MKHGIIIEHTNGSSTKKLRNGEFSIEFENKIFGPYSWLYDRERLYFDEDVGERGAYFFPLKNTMFHNTEMFLETDEIVICIGERGSFSGQERQFLEIVNIFTHNKYRLYPDEVSLIYNTKDALVIYYKKSEKYYQLIVDQKLCEEKSEKTYHVSAFIKLIFDHTTEKFGRLVYIPYDTTIHHGYFEEEILQNSDFGVPTLFDHRTFKVWGKQNTKNICIDAWEASLTGELEISN